jgi:hypothetical protein
MATTPPLSSYLPPLPSQAQLFQRAIINPIGVTAATSGNIGYLSKDKTQLEVVGQLTSQDPIDMYNFTFQQGDSVKLKLTNINETVSVHVQLYDGSGTRVLADNQGNSTTQNAYNQLASTNGLNLKTGKYVVKVSYGKGVPKTQTQNYAIQLGSGTTFNSDYRTLGTATTVNRTLLAGGSIGYNPNTTTASLLTNISLGNNLSVFDTSFLA